MKLIFFRLAVKISFGHRFPLAAMFPGHLYLQFDSICLDEICDSFCHFITACFNSLFLLGSWQIILSFEHELFHLLWLGKKVGIYNGFYWFSRNLRTKRSKSQPKEIYRVSWWWPWERVREEELVGEEQILWHIFIGDPNWSYSFFFFLFFFKSWINSFF